MSLIYKNRFIFNQRGGSIDIDNTTDQEKVKISHRSGSNINITNVVTSELAANNKQTAVLNDEFKTVANDYNQFVGSNKTERVGKTSYNLKGFINKSQLDAYTSWKQAYKEIADLNSQFKIKRGGFSTPNGSKTELSGNRANNPVIGFQIFTVENEFNGYTGVPIRKSDLDEVVDYAKVPDKNKTKPAELRDIKKEDIEQSAGATGSSAPGVLEFGADKSAATEQGNWNDNQDAQNINEKLIEIQDELLPIEKEMGDGGDEIEIIKRNKFKQVGAEFNDFPSLRIDPKGRSQPFEMLVSDTGTYKNHDYVSIAEEIDNSSNFPCGNDDAVIGNRLSRTVGSGGINLKTTGSMELGGTNLKAGFNKVHINASNGVHIASEDSVELASLKTISLRTNRQVYIESTLGVRGNVIVGGGLSVEGELYCQHITAPLEVHQTQDTTVTGKFATNENRKLLIGEAHIGDRFYPVYAVADDDLIVNYPHSHHHNGIPMRLTQSNKDTRNFAAKEGINTHSKVAQSLPQIHERKIALISN